MNKTNSLITSLVILLLPIVGSCASTSQIADQCFRAAEIPEGDGPHRILISVGSYAGDYYLNDETVASNCDRWVRLDEGNHSLRIAQLFTFPFSVTSEGNVEVPDDYQSSATSSGQSLDISHSHVDFEIDSFNLDWKIHGVREPGFNENTDPIHSFLVPSDTINSSGNIGASYRMSFGEDGSAIHIDVSSLEIMFRGGPNAGTSAFSSDGHVVKFSTREIEVVDMNGTDTEWWFQEYGKEPSSMSSAKLIPDVTFYFRSLDERVPVRVSEDCQVIPSRIVAGPADFRLRCASNDDLDIPDSINNPDIVNCNATLGSAGYEPPAHAQIVRVNKTGMLNRVDFSAMRWKVYKRPDLTLEIRDTVMGSYHGFETRMPGNSVLGSVSVRKSDLPLVGVAKATDLTTFDLQAQNIIVEAGKYYALVLTREHLSDSSEGLILNWCTAGSVDGPADFYPDGHGLWRAVPPSDWRPFGLREAMDFRFRVFVTDLK